MIFASDNWAGAHPRIAASLATHGGGYAPAYGASDLDKSVAATFSEIFEKEVAVFFVGTGTAANALSLVALDRPGGITFCHRGSHIFDDECGAPEYFSGGSRLFAVDGPFGLMDPAKLDEALGRFQPPSVHMGRPTSVSVTQATEAGTIYDLDRLDAIAAIARANGLPLHMDGARFANALVSLGTTPADMTWRRGVDVLSFGGTKNGCWCAEAVVFFDPARAADFGYIRKRGAQLFSKSRFIAAQFAAYFEDGLWLETAAHANAMAARLAACIRSSPTARLGWEPQANEVFAAMPRRLFDDLHEKGARFYDWPANELADGAVGRGEIFCRFVTSFATTVEEVDRFGALIGA